MKTFLLVLMLGAGLGISLAIEDGRRRLLPWAILAAFTALAGGCVMAWTAPGM